MVQVRKDSTTDFRTLHALRQRFVQRSIFWNLGPSQPARCRTGAEPVPLHPTKRRAAQKIRLCFSSLDVQLSLPAPAKPYSPASISSAKPHILAQTNISTGV